MTTGSPGATFGRPRIWYPTVGSTMDVAAQLAAAGAPHGTLVEAGYQSAGRGRLDRRWEAPVGSSLLASWLVRVPSGRDPGILSPLVALALLRALRRMDPSLPLSYKWPNDIWLDGRKLAGILLTSRAGIDGTVVIAGTGVNVGPMAMQVQGRAWLADWMPRATTPDIRNALASSLDETWIEFLTSAELHDGSRAELEQALLWRNRNVIVTLPDDVVPGRIIGLDRDGALLVLPEDGQIVRTFHAGEVMRGPRIPEESAP